MYVDEPTGHYIIEGSVLHSDAFIHTELHTCLNTSDVSCDFAFTVNHCNIGNIYEDYFHSGFDITVQDSNPITTPSTSQLLTVHSSMVICL